MMFKGMDGELPKAIAFTAKVISFKTYRYEKA